MGLAFRERGINTIALIFNLMQLHVNVLSFPSGSLS